MPRVPTVLLLAGLLAAAATTSPAWAHEPRNTLVPTGEVRYLPSIFPDRIILVATEDPARSQAVNWRSAPAVTTAVAQVTRARDAVGLHLTAETVTGTTRPLRSGNGLAHHHSVTFTGLEPDTVYAYRVRGLDTWSEWLQFRTAPAAFEPFSFLYFGDAQNSVKSHFSRVIRESLREAPQARFMLHAGDLVNQRAGKHDDEWGEWFEAGGFLHGMVASLPVAGNHEFIVNTDESGAEHRSLAQIWPLQFAVPRNGPAGLEDTVYFVQYPEVLFVVLDSMRALDDPALAVQQAEWLDRVLQRRKQRWVVVSYHHPMFSVSMGRDNPPLREHWKPVLDRHGVDLVLQGHDHAYGRGANMPEGLMVIDGDLGPVYVVSVAGPKMYLVSDEAEAMLERTGEDVQLYQVIHVEADRLRFESRTPTGRVYDAFDIERLPDGRKRLVERLPAGTPEDRCSNPQLPRPTRCWEGIELVD
jgi:acid phosphatase type 7